MAEIKIPRKHRNKKGMALYGGSISHAHSRVHEQDIAGNVGGELTPRSGAGKIKGDVRVKGVARIECKTTKNKSYSVKLDLLDSLEEAAMGSGETVAVFIRFIDSEGNILRDLAVLPAGCVEAAIRGQGNEPI